MAQALEEGMNRCRRLLKLFLAGYVSCFFLFAGTDYFLAQEAVLAPSIEKFNQYFSAAYPDCTIHDKCIWNFGARPDPNVSGIRDSRHASVVLWTDRGLARKDLVWPIRMENHADALEAILAYGPKGVFVDIVFVDDPARRGDDSLDDLVDVFELYEEADVPLYLADPDLADLEVLESLRNALREDALIPIVLQSRSSQYAYHSVVELKNGESRANGAMAVYRQGAGAQNEDFGPREFQLFWGGSANEISRKGWDCHGIDMPGSFHHLLYWAAVDVVVPVWNFLVSQSRYGGGATSSGSASHTEAFPCPYLPVLPADMFIDLPTCVPGDQGCASAAEVSNRLVGELAFDDLRSSITDRYVVYGASIHGADDIFEIPIYDHRGLPGAFVHAMALDNLIESKGNVQPAPNSRTLAGEVANYALSALLATFSLFGVVLLLFRVRPRLRDMVEKKIKNHAPRFDRPWLLALVHGGVNILCHVLLIVGVGGGLLFVTWAIYLWSDLGILNWLAILLSSGALSLFANASLTRNLLGHGDQSSSSP